MTELILGKMKGVILEEFTYSVYNLLITERRIVGDKIGDEDVAFVLSGLSGLFFATSCLEKAARQMEMQDNADEILSKHKRNFEIRWSEIEQVIIKKIKVKIKLNQRKKILGRKPTFVIFMEDYEKVVDIFKKMLPNTTVK